MNSASETPAVPHPHRFLIIGWLGLLAITVAVFTQFQTMSQLASSAFGSPEAGSISSEIFVGIFPHALSAIAIVASIGMVMIQAPARWKYAMILTMILVLVAFEYHWPANWFTADELRVIASLFFIFSMATITILAVALFARATCRWRLTTGENSVAPTRSISLSELIALAGAAACTLALGRQTEFTITELFDWCLGTTAYVIVLSARLLSLAVDSGIRRWGRVFGILAYAILLVVEELWPFDQLSSTTAQRIDVGEMRLIGETDRIGVSWLFGSLSHGCRSSCWFARKACCVLETVFVLRLSRSGRARRNLR